MEHFRKLGIIEPILSSIKDEKFEEPTEIQVKSIPLILEGKDVIAKSATGSGKTLAFGTGIIQNVKRGEGIQALVLTPTRELAGQVAKSLVTFSRYKPLKIVPIYGGVPIKPQIRALSKADVVVGTPGRMLDHIGRGTIDLDNVDILVLDEVDTMLDMGFIDDVKKILKACPLQRQMLMFSATIPKDIARLARKYMNDPVRISAGAHVDPKKLAQVFYRVDKKLKFSLLLHLVNNEKSGLTMVFCNTQVNTDFVANNLKKCGIDAVGIHGGLTQQKRNKVMKMFHSGEAYVLVCTDVAARGLDIPNVSHVYNYDIPRESKQYIHRIGRTARAGKEGKAINILTSADKTNFKNVLRDNDVNIIEERTPKVEYVPIKWTGKNKGAKGKHMQHRRR